MSMGIFVSLLCSSVTLGPTSACVFIEMCQVAHDYYCILVSGVLHFILHACISSDVRIIAMCLY